MTASNKKMFSALPLLLTFLILWEQIMKQGVLSTQLGSLTGSGQLRPRTEKQNCEFSDERKRIEILIFGCLVSVRLPYEHLSLSGFKYYCLLFTIQ
jgi:hypothetical protein